MPEHMRRILPPVVLILLLALGGVGYYLYTLQAAPADSSIRASGTVESVEVLIAAEISGRVTEVLAEEGAAVKKGDLLLRLDGTLVTAQRDASAAALESARAAEATAKAAAEIAALQYQQALDAALLADSPARSKSWATPAPGDFDNPSWYFDKDEQARAMQAEVDEAAKSLDVARQNLARVQKNPALEGILRAEERLARARAAYLVAKDVLDRANAASDREELQDYAQDQFDAAQDELEDAQEDYDDLLGTDEADELLRARAQFAAAEERYYAALDRLMRMRTGEDAASVQIAAAVRRQADLTARQAALAVSLAQAQLRTLDAQIAKLLVYAPADGVILNRSVEPGEMLLAGASAMTMQKAGSLTITVYIPEDRYGEIRLGQGADIAVDSFPGSVFRGIVARIAVQAEFTPRNVQTDSGRRTMMFAIELTVTDPEGRLKAGMPADVVFR